MATRDQSAESRAIDEVIAEDERALEEVARSAGPPPDADTLSEADEDLAWEFADPSVDYDDLAAQVMTQGVPPEIAQRLLIVKLRPDWLPLYGQPTQDAELANQLARLAQYPFRASILEGIDDPDEQVKAAERLDRRWQKRLTAMQEQDAMPMMTRGGPQGGAPSFVTTRGYEGMPREGA